MHVVYLQNWLEDPVVDRFASLGRRASTQAIYTHRFQALGREIPPWEALYSLRYRTVTRIGHARFAQGRRLCRGGAPDGHGFETDG